MPQRNRQTGESLSPARALQLLIAMMILVPLVLKGDLLQFTLLPKRLVVQAILFALQILIATHATNGRFRGLPRTVLNLPILTYVLWTAVALLWAGNRIAALGAIGHLLTYAMLFAATIVTLRREDLSRLIEAVCWVGAGVSLIGLGEFWGLDLFQSNGRPSATFGYRNMAAAYLVMAIPLSVGVLLTARSGRAFGIGVIAATLMSIFLVYTRTRGAWAALFAATVVTAGFALVYHPSVGAVLSRSGKKWIAAGLIGFLLLAPWNPRLSTTRSRHLDEGKASLVNALSSANRPGADRGRRAMWSHTVEMISDHPAFGIGPGNWLFAYPPYDGGDMLRVGSAPERPHNDYLWIASETGLIGLALYSWLIIAALLLCLRRIRDPQTRLWGLAIGASIVSMLGHAVFSFPKELAETSMLFWMNLALLVVLSRDETSVVSLPKPFWVLSTGLAAGCLFLTIMHLRFDRRLMDALSFQAGNDLRGTLLRSTEALEIGPFDPRAHQLQAKGYQATGQYIRAIDAGKEGLKYHPHSPELLGDLGTNLALSGDLDGAEKAYRRALSLAPYHYQMLNNLGGIAQQRGHLNEAIGLYRQAISRKPDYVDGWSNLGLALIGTNAAAEAVDAIQKAISLAPGEVSFYYDLGEAHSLGAADNPRHLQQALNAYRTFLRRWPIDDDAARHARDRIAALSRLQAAP